MRLVVFGSSGGVGRHLVALGMSRGHAILAVARPGSAVPEGVEVARLDVTLDPLEPVLQGADAVLSALGMRRKQLWNPYSRVLCGTDFCSATAQRIVDAMTEAGVKRVIAVSAAGVADSAPQMNPIMRKLVATSSIGVAYRDLAVMERVYLDHIDESVLVRPVTLTNSAVADTREVDHFGMFMSISRASVASWMLDAVEATAVARGTHQIAAQG